MLQLSVQNVFFTIIICLLVACQGTSPKTSNHANTKNSLTDTLCDGWKMKRAAEVSKTGKELSEAAPDTQGWLSAKLPNTVMAILINNGIYKDPYSENNLAKVPMDSILKPWWFTKSFTVEDITGKTFMLNFDGINYKAEVYLNGELLADTNAIAGAFNTFEVPVKNYIKQGKNHLAIKLLPPGTGAYSIGFVDWAPTPPDKNMGIWRGVFLKASQEVALKETFVQSKLNLTDFSTAALTLSTVLKNNTDQEQKVTLKGTLGEFTFEHAVDLKGNETQKVTLTPNEIKVLKLENPKVWWPVGYGSPNLYKLKLSALVNEQISSEETVTFGVREIEDYKNENGHRGYKVNGKKILLKGAGWLDKLFLENDSVYDREQIKYVVDMNMNCVRFEGFWGKNQHVYDLCDQYGLLAMVGFSCHWEWTDYIGTPCGDQFGCAEEKEEIELLANYWESQVKYLRNHPSIFAWVGGSDFLPHPDLEKKYLEILKEHLPDAPYLGAAKWHKSAVSDGTGVKMEGPYDYVTPNYWYTDTMRGGAFGFNTETGPGPQPPVLSSLLKMYGKDINYPIDSTWDYHHGRFAFGTMNKYLKAFERRYGPSATLENFALASQMASYEAIRPMYEAFRINQPNTTGIIQWMLNSAWPETFWQLYDFYLAPTGAYYGTKKANEQVQSMYNYGNHHVYLVNDKATSLDSAHVKIEVFNTKSELLYEMDTTLTGVVSGPHSVFKLKPTLEKTEFLFITTTQGNKVLKNNYWLSSVKDVIDPNYENSSWIYTPNLSFCDFTALRKLTPTKINLKTENTETGMKVHLKNEGSNIAFGVELTLIDKETNQMITPVRWEDNYLVMRGEEELEIEVLFRRETGKDYSIQMQGINSTQ